jgi:hypothetical protein
LKHSCNVVRPVHMSIRYTLSILAIAMCSAIGQTTTNSSTRTFDFPLVGLGGTETAEINVVNVATNTTGGTAASCTGTMSFTNPAGTAIGSATAFTSLPAGQVATARLPFSSSGGTSPRTQIRGVVTLTVPTTTPRPPCVLSITFATYDTTTGATHVFLSGDQTLQSGGPHGR